MKDEELMKLNIQFFAEEADNDDDFEDENIEDQDIKVEEDIITGDATGKEKKEDEESSKETPIDKTKAFSERLKAEKAKLKDELANESNKKIQERLDEVAKINGFDKWEDFEKATTRDKMIEAGVEDPEKFEKIIDSIINNRPEFIEAKKIKEENEAEKQQRIIDEQIKLINKVDSTINSIDDISKLDNCEAITDKVKKGYGLYDAYLLVNIDKIQNNKVELGKKAALNNIDNKSHLKSTSGKESSLVNVPKEVYDIYKANFRKWTDQQIIDDYKKRLEENK